MIKRLRLRMTLMVIAVLVFVSAGIVIAIHLSSQRNITMQAESALAELADGRGKLIYSRDDDDWMTGTTGKKRAAGKASRRLSGTAGRLLPPD